MGAEAAEPVRRLVRRVMGGPSAVPFGLYLFGPDDPGADLARRVEEEVFLETFGNTPELLAKEYGQYEPSSIFLCVVDHLRELPVGAMRIVVPSAAGFKTFDDIGPVWHDDVEAMFERTGVALVPGRIWDVATMAVASEYRGKAVIGLATLGLYQGLVQTARRCGIEYFVCILDMPIFRMMQSKLHLTFAGFAGVGPLPYLGSPASLPVWCYLPDVKGRFAAADMNLHHIVFEGTGLEAVVEPLDLEAAVAVARGRAELAAATGIRTLGHP
ncbi:MAG TPA: hypothetical protein VEI83_14865 [Acidimicrobiales bacterium]|nr:hypothetical protein [Acidimicrobiales bacterium]